MRCSTPLTVDRRQAQTLLAAVLTAQAHTGDEAFEGARLMLVAALERISRAEARAMRRVPV